MADREIKTTLALDGEKQFKAAMDESIRGLKVLGSEMKLNTAIFGDNGSSMEGLTKKGEILNKEIAKQKELIETISRALKEAEATYGENSKQADAYRIKLNNASAALAKTESAAQQNEAAIQNLGKETEATKKKTIDWTGSIENMDKALSSGLKACTAVIAGIAAVGAAAVAAGAQIFNATVEAGKMADELITLSNKTGVSTQTLQEWTYAAQFIDTEVETMTGSMAKLIRQMDAARDGTGTSSEAFRALNISVMDSGGALRDSETVFMEAIDALGRVANEAERDALAMQIFGKSAQDLNPLIIAGSAELKRLGQEANTVGAVMSGETIGAFGAFDDSMNVLNFTVDGVKNSFLTALLPAVQAVIPIVQDIALRFSEWLRSDGAQAMLANLVEKITSVASSIGENLTPIVNGAIGAFESITAAIGWGIQNFEGIKTAVIAAVAVFGTLAAIQTVLAVKQAIVNAVMMANPIGLVVMAIAALVAAIVVLVRNWDNIKQAVGKAWEAIKGAVAAGVQAVIGAFKSVIEWFGNLATGIWNAGVNLVKGLWEGIKSATTWLWNKISGWISDALGWIADLLGIHSPSRVMRDMIGKPMVQGMAEGITKNAGLVNRALGSLVPDTGVMLDVTRHFNDVSGSAVGPRYSRESAGGISDSAVDRIVRGFKAAISEQGDPVIIMDDRELGRVIRKLSFA